MNHKTIQTAFFLILLVGVLVLVFFLIQPFLTPLLLAFTLAILFHPLYEWLSRVLRGKRVAALLSILAIFVIVMAPLLFFGVQVFNEGRDFYFNHLIHRETVTLVPSGVMRFVDQLPPQHQAYVADRLQALNQNFSEYAKDGLVWVLQHVGVIFSSIAHLAFTLVFTLISLYFFFTQGGAFKARLIAVSPLADRYDNAIISRLEVTVSSVIKGVLVIAVVQAVLTGIGFTLFGVPNPALWGSVAMLASLVPGFGTALITVPAILYLLLSGHVAAAIGLTLWGALFVGLIDNFLSPMIVGHGIKINTFIVLLGALGGLAFFGPVGFIAGPLILSLLFALLDIYPTLILHEHPRYHEQP